MGRPVRIVVGVDGVRAESTGVGWAAREAGGWGAEPRVAPAQHLVDHEVTFAREAVSERPAYSSRGGLIDASGDADRLVVGSPGGCRRGGGIGLGVAGAYSLRPLPGRRRPRQGRWGAV